jgi:phosphonate transport system substrate-binding protein
MLRTLWYLVLFSAILTGTGCKKAEEKKIVLEPTGTAVDIPKEREEKKVRIAVGGMITPKEGMGYYRDFLRYIEEKIGINVEYVDREGYAEINEMLKNRQLEAAFVCSGPYVDGHRQFGLELLAAPQAYGKTVYYSYIIVAKDSPVGSFAALRGKRFAFTDPLSNTGKLVPTYMLSRMRETPETFFKEFIYTKAHDKSIKAVAQGIVDAAAVDSLIWEYLNAANQEHVVRTRILQKSPSYAIPPIAVPRELDPGLKAKMRHAVLNAHTDPKGREILKKMKIDKFVIIDDMAYDSVREMQVWIKKQEADR